MRTAAIIALALLGACILPASSTAATWCVAKPGCVGTAEPGVQEAFTAASNAPGDDRVEIGPGTFSTATDFSTYNSGRVDVVGSGPSTVLTAANPSFAGLNLSGESASVSDLTVRADHGIVASVRGSVDHVTLEGQDSDGLRIQGTGSVSDTDIHVASGNEAGIYAQGATTQIDQVHIDVPGTAITSVMSDLTVDRMTARARNGVSAESGFIELDDSSIELSGDGNGVAAVASQPGTALSVALDHVLIHGNGHRTFGVFSDAGPGGGSTGTRSASVTARNTIITGVQTNWARFGGGAGENYYANVTLRYDDLDPAANQQSTGAGFVTSTPNVSVDPGFVGGGDRHLRHDSALIDAGDPAATSGTDLDGSPFPVDGDGNGTARQDIGPFEYQRRAPVLAPAGPAALKTGQAGTFTSGGYDPDPGETPTYTWSFDDGAHATGGSAVHAFQTPGPHTASVTATDPVGLTTTASRTVQVTQPSTASGGRPSGPPRLTAVTASPRTFHIAGALPAISSAARTSTTVGFRLDRAARIVLSFSRPARGRRHGRSCVAPTARNRSARSCTRYLRAGSVTVAGHAGRDRIRFTGRLSRRRTLRPGRYRMTVTAIDGTRRTTAKPITLRLLPRIRHH